MAAQRGGGGGGGRARAAEASSTQASATWAARTKQRNSDRPGALMGLGSDDNGLHLVAATRLARQRGRVTFKPAVARRRGGQWDTTMSRGRDNQTDECRPWALAAWRWPTMNCVAVAAAPRTWARLGAEQAAHACARWRPVTATKQGTANKQQARGPTTSWMDSSLITKQPTPAVARGSREGGGAATACWDHNITVARNGAGCGVCGGG